MASSWAEREGDRRKEGGREEVSEREQRSRATNLIESQERDTCMRSLQALGSLKRPISMGTGGTRGEEGTMEAHAALRLCRLRIEPTRDQEQKESQCEYFLKTF